MRERRRKWRTVDTFVRDGTRMALQQRVFAEGEYDEVVTEPGDKHRMVTVGELL